MSMLLRGFSNISTIEHMSSTESNQSEIASFYLLLLPLVTLFLIRLVQKAMTALESSLVLIIGFTLVYMFIGFPSWLSDYLLWGRVPLQRADLALGLASLMLTHLLLTTNNQLGQVSSVIKSTAIIVALTWSYIVYRALEDLPPSILSEIDINIIIAVLLVTAATGYFLIANKIRPFMWMSLGLSLATTAHFNPLNIAPNNVSIQFPNGINNGTDNPTTNSRVLVIESFVTPMFFAASGIPVANGTFYYPQKMLWNRLDPEGKHRDTYNRYQRLIFTGTDSVDDYMLDTPSPDIVRVNINLQRFDFQKSGANFLLAPDGETKELNFNSSLSFINSADGWSWFSIVKN